MDEPDRCGRGPPVDAAGRHAATVSIEIVSWQELVRRAGSPARARRQLVEGAWWRVTHDAYAPGDVPDGPVVKVLALRRVLPPDVAVSHRAALWVLGCDVLGPDVQVTVPRGRHLERRSRFRPYTAFIPDDDLTEVAGLLVVTAARAVVDVSRSEPLVEAVAVADAALRRGVTTVPLLARAVEQAAGLRHVERARTVLVHAEPRSESPMESRFRMRLVLGGVPRPEAQWDVYTEHGHVGRVDLRLRGAVFEYDGRAERLDKTAFVAERRRATLLSDTRLELRRFTAADVYVRPAAAVCAEVMRAVALGDERTRPALRHGPDTQPRPRKRPLPSPGSRAAA